MKVSIVVPAYNEVANMPFLIEEFDKFIKKHKNYEVIVVDDGSEDGTLDMLKKKKRSYLRTVRHKRNLGKTQAILSGAKIAKSQSPFRRSSEKAAPQPSPFSITAMAASLSRTRRPKELSTTLPSSSFLAL